MSPCRAKTEADSGESILPYLKFVRVTYMSVYLVICLTLATCQAKIIVAVPTDKANKLGR